jgi:tetratricopeptide (TPR) repeat protein/transcriptional regulator with XRE-family HTH domain
MRPSQRRRRPNRRRQRRAAAPDAEDLRVLVGLLRLLRNLPQAGMARAVKLHPSTLCRYERGSTTPKPQAIEKLARAAAVPMWAIDGILLPAIAQARSLAAGGASDPSGDIERLLAAALGQRHSPAASAGIAEFLAATSDDQAPAGPALPPPGQQHLPDQDAWQLAVAAALERGRAQPDLWPAFESLAVRLCTESEQAAARDAALALQWARLALAVAELAPGVAAWRAALLGYAWAFLANALRVGSDLPAAEAAFATAWALWREGALPPGSSLAEWRLLDLEASLRRDQRQFATALDLLERALAAAPDAARGRILLKTAYTLDQAGRAEAALAILRQAAPLVDAGAEPRQSWILKNNLLLVLCQLGRYADAEAGLPELHRLTREIGNDLDELRTRWTTARVWLGLGRRAEAAAELDQVRHAFSQRRQAYDTALVSLELAIFLLEEGRAAEVRALSAEMLWIFTAQQVQREALSALSLFCRAAESETLTLDLARRLLRSLERSRGAVPPLPIEHLA